MKLRLGASILVATFLALPAVLPAGAPLALSHAHAQDAATEIARQRYKEGVTAFDAGRYEEARVAFLQAYALKRHPAVLLNLGLSELRSNHTVDAGNHLTQFLREAKEATPEQRQTAQGAIEEAKRKAAHLVIVVDQPNADVSVDGTLIGKSPLADPVFVEPGLRTVVATLDGRNTTFAAQARRGAATNVSLAFGGAPAAPPPVAPFPPPGGDPMQPPPHGVGPVAPPPPPPPDAGGKESFFEWYGRKPLAWVGTGVTVVGLGLGIAFSSLAGSASSSADEAADAIRDKRAELGVEQAPCGPEDSTGGQDLVGFQAECSALRESLSDYDADVAVATVGWVAFGVGLAGTVTYVLVDYVADEDSGRETGRRGPPLVTPVVGPGFQGVTMQGTF